MATRECPQCFEGIDTRAKVCPHCQNKIPDQEFFHKAMKDHEETMNIVAGVILAIAAIIFVYLAW